MAKYAVTVFHAHSAKPEIKIVDQPNPRLAAVQVRKDSPGCQINSIKPHKG